MDELARDFRAAYGDDFEIVAEGREEVEGAAYWLVTVRPRRSGEFYFRHRFEQAASYRFHDDEGRIVVLRAGERRQVRFDSAPQSVCVGDTLLVPVPLPAGAAQHRFLKESRFPRYYDSEFAGRDFRSAERAQTHGPLLYVGRESHMAVHRDGRMATLSFDAFFEAATPGRCNLRLAATAAPLSILVVSGEAPIQALLAHVSTHAFDKPEQVSTGWSAFDTSLVMMRPGDRLRVAYGRRTVASEDGMRQLADEVAPRVEIAPFAVARQPVWNAWSGRGITRS
ncbi:MAG: hypothetical protein U0R19_15265 [Bryobacteraceae bacterium]